ncbi:Protein OS-9 [Cadophora gregata]|uniref:Protein OS-9 n=1 Tax=Cadophora gregata TaxID=51156 RepID=UPI0026DB0A6E|nr:Protein OS-9 [Cadophora gregata]KAK0101239.1 Protein OS-9 [Cadophora gregata]KAK0106748.1 Protein OS-9 [Cadophora gregata f. sp. sojae]
MQHIITALLASVPIVLASQTVFSVHDDLLAFPQYEVAFPDSFISDVEAKSIIEQASAAIPKSPQSSDTTSIASRTDEAPQPPSDHAFDPKHETYELMYLNGEQHLCTIPIVDTPAKNETSEAEARAAEQKELARATNRGWELLQELDGGCLYFVSGWWSYAFCYNNEITQFHQLPPQPGKPLLPPQPDPTTKQFVLGRAKAKGKPSKDDEWEKEIEAPKKKASEEPPKTELQIKGDTRYLVQKMEGGTTCDLTGKPRRVEVQFHCNPHVTDRIGYIKEVTTCSYLMVVYTPRLCSDVAFQPPKVTKAHSIVCRAVVPEEDLQDRSELKEIENQIAAEKEQPINVGGVILGAGKWINKEGQRLPIPANFGQEPPGKVVEVIARAKSKVEGGKVEMASDKELAKLDLDPEMVETVKKQVQKLAKEKGWKIEVVDAPGQIREILGIVDEDEDEPEDEEGSQEVFYKDEL